jgi:3-methyladenine DNA glycosylase/8-oxoguanine DNA glycosylase
VVIDECLSVQNANAKRCASAWRQVEVSTCGVLMLSATFFRSKFDSLFYMIRMLRGCLPRDLEFLPATIHEHIVCQVPATDRTWTMRPAPVPLPPSDLLQYRKIIEAFKRKQLNTGEADGRKLSADLEAFLRKAFEGRADTGAAAAYQSKSVMGQAIAKECEKLLKQKRKPLVFADTRAEQEHIMTILRARGIHASTWAEAREHVSMSSDGGVIVAVKSIDGQGVNMQHHADAIVCRPTPGDLLEQMKGRVDRPGQQAKELILVVVMAEHTLEEARFANIRLTGSFFREYIAPVAKRYRERIDLEATLEAGGSKQLKKFTVRDAWKKSLEAAGSSGAFARLGGDAGCGGPQELESEDEEEEASAEEEQGRKRARGAGSSGGGQAAAVSGKGGKGGKGGKAKGQARGKAKGGDDEDEEGDVKKYASLNKVIRNKGDKEAVRQAKEEAKAGRASLAVRRWLFPPPEARPKRVPGALAKDSPKRWSDAKPPLVLTPEVIDEVRPSHHTTTTIFRYGQMLTLRARSQGIEHISRADPKLAALITRIGADALYMDVGGVKVPTQARLFDKCVKAITFTMISVDAGNSFLRRLAIKIGVSIEVMTEARRKAVLDEAVAEISASGGRMHSAEEILSLLLAGQSNEILFTCGLVNALTKVCEKGKNRGYPHLCGVTFTCGKNDDPKVFLQKAREHAAGGDVPVSAGYSANKAGFIVSLVESFEKGEISGEKMAAASDREAGQMLCKLKGIGPWSASSVLMHYLKRADVMLYGDLTVRNYLNDLYNIEHKESETLLESAADFDDNGRNQNLIDKVAKEHGWAPYRSIVCFLMYRLQEDNLVLL